MWTRNLLKENGKIAFKRNYWLCVVACLITMLLGGLANNTGTSSSLNLDSLRGNNNNLEIDGFGELDQLGEFDDYIDMSGELTLDNFGSTVNSMIKSIPSYIFAILGAVILIGVVLGLAMSILVSNVVNVGCCRFFMENREHKTPIGAVFHGFKKGRYLSTVFTMFVKNLYVFLWSLLLVVPGIVKGYSYYMVSYIVAENSELDKNRVFEMSKAMMKGHKWEAFVLELSFIGWVILGGLTAGILNIFYVNPYMLATKAEFYTAIKAEALQKGIVSYDELPGVVPPVEEVEVVF